MGVYSQFTHVTTKLMHIYGKTHATPTDTCRKFFPFQSHNSFHREVVSRFKIIIMTRPAKKNRISEKKHNFGVVFLGRELLNFLTRTTVEYFANIFGGFKAVALPFEFRKK